MQSRMKRFLLSGQNVNPNRNIGWGIEKFLPATGMRVFAPLRLRGADYAKGPGCTANNAGEATRQN
jgi:hypothetical protein